MKGKIVFENNGRYTCILCYTNKIYCGQKSFERMCSCRGGICKDGWNKRWILLVKRCFEVKYAKFQNDLERSCEEAVAQIDSRMYREEFQDDYSKVFCYGISFYKKRCFIQLKE